MSSISLLLKTFLRSQSRNAAIALLLLIIAVIAARWELINSINIVILNGLIHLEKHLETWAESQNSLELFLKIWLLGPIILVFTVSQTWSQPLGWAGITVISILLLLKERYFFWRITSTLNLNSPFEGMFSLSLLFLETIVLVYTSINLLQQLYLCDRHKDADYYSEAVRNHAYQPTVDVLIPSYNEPEFILQRTIMGCQAMNYGPKKIYLLDDGRRPEIRKLAAELGCEYITRIDNHNAKAGNLNNALGQTEGELVVVFDADYVPTQNFLARTVGFFQNKTIAVVQTPQNFFNHDPIARNLGLANILNPEEELFYRQRQRAWDGAGAIVLVGTAVVLRRSALEEIGGFVTKSISEDLFTGIHLVAAGYQMVYLNEKLSAGLAAENIVSHTLQRMRWCQGTLQAFFMSSNPLTIPGLSFMQRLGYFQVILFWLTNISRGCFLIAPLLSIYLGVNPINATELDFFYYYAPLYASHFISFSWLHYRSKSSLTYDVSHTITVFPLTIKVFQVITQPFSGGFSVTPKGISNNRYSFNWQLVWPLLILFILTALSLWLGIVILTDSIFLSNSNKEISPIYLIWSSYNLIILGIAILAMIDAPQLNRHEWFEVQLKATITTDYGKKLWGVTTHVSEEGVKIILPAHERENFKEPNITLHVGKEKICLSSISFHCTSIGSNYIQLTLLFNSLTLDQKRRLVELLYCKEGQWKDRYEPSEWHCLWLLLVSLKDKFSSRQRLNIAQRSLI